MNIDIHVVDGSRGAENVRTRERGSGEILINNGKKKAQKENKWKFPLTGGNFHKYQNK